MPALLTVDKLTKCYGSVKVLDDCRFEVQPGEVHALLGANGAGKSTTVRIVAGLVEPTGGSMHLHGQPFAPHAKREAENAGVQIVQQELNLIPTLSVAENLYLTRLPATGGVIRSSELHENAKKLLSRFGLDQVDTKNLVGGLGVGIQQMIEIAAALDQDCRLLILDEPTAALSATETEKLFGWLDELRQQGVGIVYISHRLNEVARIADRLTVLVDGKSIGTFETQTLTTNAMVDLMSAENTVTSSPHASEHISYVTETIAMRTQELSRGFVKDISIHVHQGERLGIAGLVGSGRTELLRMIFGADVAETGHVLVENDPTQHRFQHPSQAVNAGLAMVTEDRKYDGLLLSQSIQRNTTLASLWNRFSRRGILQMTDEQEESVLMCESMETRCVNTEQIVRTLSGGNQQKVAIAKWLVGDAHLFLFDEPTRGIDVAARRRIYRLLDTLARSGKGMVIVSSDLEELMETCDRIAVMSNGRIAATFDRESWSEEEIMLASFAGYIDQECRS